MTDIVPPTCGSCFHWALQTEGTGPVTIGAPKRGICYGAPPAAFAIIDSRSQRVAAQTNLRPVLPETERICGFYVPRDQVDAALKSAMKSMLDEPQGNG